MAIRTDAPDSPPAPATTHAPPAHRGRIVIQYPVPAVDGGAYPVKRCAGDTVAVAVDVFRDGHELLRAVVRHTDPDGNTGESELHRSDAHLGGVRWAGAFTVDRPGRWRYAIEAWTDLFGTWRDELRRKVAAAQQDLSGELSEGIVLLQAAAAHTDDPDDRALIEHAIAELQDPGTPHSAKHDVALGDELAAAVERDPIRHEAVTLEPPIDVRVDRLRARFGAWYELFPRSWGGLKGVEREIPRLAELGFDVVYLPPIHPIGQTNRKGKDNALTAAPGDPGSPWAIGDRTGGHDAIHPDLGSEDDLRALTATAADHGIEIALDFAIQCSADHPWLSEHPEWFHRRPDGT
ncbi:MAG TPA: maltotransferase domain-containing protein, partial [Solirubrobacteraceae bacterium]|nr:maltotransferase domain-containing protein [Solirubrobacteraceae bacterium]